MPIESITEGLSRDEQQTRYSGVVNEQVHFMARDAKAREIRSVENMGDSDSSKPKAEMQSDTTTKTDIVDKNVVVFTRYDSEGREINRVPAEYDARG
jgi:hypothetical protein